MRSLSVFYGIYKAGVAAHPGQDPRLRTFPSEGDAGLALDTPLKRRRL